jgi:F-box-like
MLYIDESCCGSKVVEVSIIHKFLLVHHQLDGTDSDRLYPRVTIGKLPDDVLLEIFYMARCQVDDVNRPKYFEDRWRTLVHVCKQWRSIVFSSPRRLDLQLFCTNRRPVKKLLDIWPPLPIYIFAIKPSEKSPMRGVTDLMAALEQQNRVRGICIRRAPNSLLKQLVAMAVKPYPALTVLDLSSNDETALVLPDSFLGGSVPHMRTIVLRGIPFPGLGQLLLSANDLVSLSLSKIPHSGYISPEAIVASLSMLTRLEILDPRFRSPPSWAVRENRHPLHTRVVLPALNWLWFKGDSEYVEDILSRIDAPLLSSMDITFFNQLVFHTPQLRHFISRMVIFKAPGRGYIYFDDDNVTVDPFQTLSLRILCKPSDWQLSSLSQLYNSALSPLPTLEHLEIHNRREYWEDDMEDVQWLELLCLFPSLKDLVLSGKSFRLLTPALNELNGESITEVLPALQNIIIQGPQSSEADNKAIGKFIATRQFLGIPITIRHRDSFDLDG